MPQKKSSLIARSSEGFNVSQSAAQPAQEIKVLIETRQDIWKPFLDSYPPDQQTELEFETDADAKKAISLLWKRELYQCPHHLTPDGVIVPAPAVPYFRDAGLKFSEHHLA
jgi:hypothetical protein